MIKIGSTEYDDGWIHLEMAERCAALRQSQQLSREEIAFRFMTHFHSVPERDSVLAWIAELFRSGAVTGDAVDDMAHMASRFGEMMCDITAPHTPGSPKDWVLEQFEGSFPGRRPFDLSWDELDEFLADAARKARTGRD